MKRFGVLVLGAALALGAAVGVAHAAAGGKPPASRYLVSYSAGKGTQLKAAIAKAGGKVVLEYAPINGLAAELSSSALSAVRKSGLATTIEADEVLTLDGQPDFTQEFVPWGVDRVNADAVWSTDASGGDPNVAPGTVAGQGVVVGVLDTGVDYGHPDIAPALIDDRGTGVVRDFLDGDDDPTDATNNGHGSDCTSVIASADNDIGVIGVAPKAKVRPYRVCDGGCPLSAIIGGVVQATLDGVDVINMSFGGSAGKNLEASAIQFANSHGVVLVASAGNSATQKPSFPAAYDTVIAVGATDIHDNPASFTNYGGWVDVTGPGVAIPVATCRGCGRDSSLEETSPNAAAFDSNGLTNSALASVVDTEVVYVGRACAATAGDTLAADPAGKVALIVRGACTFAEKVQTAEAAGAVATILMNNAPGGFAGTLGAYAASGPSVSISSEDGAVLQGEIAGGTTKVSVAVFATDYAVVDGTSFSGPHVAGVAALVKSANPSLSPIQVRKIIESTAEPIGAQVIFGGGMVRADRAVSAAN